MTTIGEVVARLRNSIKEVSDDSVFSNRYLWNTYLTALKQLLKQDTTSGNIFSMSDVWEPICIELEPVNSIYCDCMYLPNNCEVYRSKVRLPKFMESNDGMIYRWLATPDLSRTFVIVSPYQYSVKSKIKYNRTKYAFIHNGFLYTPSEKYPWLSLSAIFVEDVTKFKCQDTKNNNSKSNPFEVIENTSCGAMLKSKVALPDYLEDAAIKMARAELLPVTQLRQDEVINMNTNQRDASI